MHHLLNMLMLSKFAKRFIEFMIKFNNLLYLVPRTIGGNITGQNY
jgi:hypothetical protein